MCYQNKFLYCVHNHSHMILLSTSNKKHFNKKLMWKIRVGKFNEKYENKTEKVNKIEQ